MEQNKSVIEVDLLALLYYLWKKITIVLAVTVAFGAAGFLWNTLFVTPQYTASTRIYVLNRTNENAVASSDFQISNYMIRDYQELIKGRNLTAEVIDRLSLDMSSGALSSKISVSIPENTRIVQINVQDSDPQRAALIADTVREVAITQLTEIMKVDAATTIYEAAVPVNPSAPLVAKNTALIAVTGLLLTVIVLGAIFLADRRIRSEEDVERYLGIGTLGTIPDFETNKKSRKNTRSANIAGTRQTKR